MKEGLVEEIVERYEGDAGMLIPMMQDLQAHYGYLPAQELRSLSKQLHVPLSRVYSVATFYASFRHAPRGQHEVTLCMGTVCYLKGADRISKTICEEYSIQSGGTTADRLFTLQAVNCVGACALAPVMIVDGKYHDGVTPESALEILRTLPHAEGAEAPVEKAASGKDRAKEKVKSGKGKVREKVVASPGKKGKKPSSGEGKRSKTRASSTAGVKAKEARA